MSYSIQLPVHASPAQLRVAADFFSKLADVRMQEEAEFEEMVRVTDNATQRTEGVTLEERSSLGDMAHSIIATANSTEEAARALKVVKGDDPAAPAASAVFGGAAAQAPLPGPASTSPGVPAPQSASASESSETSTAASAAHGGQSTAPAVAAPSASDGPFATGATVPGPSSTIPGPSAAPAAAAPVPGPTITAEAATIGLPAPSMTTTGPELDAEGLPWHHEIHSSSKARNQDGTWRQKKGVDKDLLARVKGELKAMMGGTAPRAEALAPSASPQTTTTPAPSAAAPASDNGRTALMMWLNGPMTSQPQKITMADLNAAIGDVAALHGLAEPAGGFTIKSLMVAPATMIATIQSELRTLALSRGWVEEVAQ